MEIPAEQPGQVGLGYVKPEEHPSRLYIRGGEKRGEEGGPWMSYFFHPFLPPRSQLTKIPMHLFLVSGITAMKGFSEHMCESGL